MSADPKHTCHECGGQISYPQDAFGTTVHCPHCQMQTSLGEIYPDTQAVPTPVQTKRLPPTEAVTVETDGPKPSRHGHLAFVITAVASMLVIAMAVQYAMHTEAAKRTGLTAERQAKDKAVKTATGDLQISLMWDNFNDLDLQCIEPNGQRICYALKRSKSGGELDVEMNAKPPYSKEPVENIYWPQNSAPQGRYQVFVVHVSVNSPENETPYTVAIKQGGKAHEFRDVIRHGQTNLVHTFTVGVQ